MSNGQEVVGEQGYGDVVLPLETKPGVKTTEFWGALSANLLGVYELVFGGLNVQNEWVVIALAIVNGLYATGRGLAKQGIPADPDA